MHDAGGSTDLSLTRVVAAVVRRDDRYLICQRPRHKRHGGLWEFPGGKCEPDESDRAAVSRELLEELELVVGQVSDVLFAHRDPDSPFLIVFLEASVNGEPRCHEHAAVEWASLERLLELPLAPTDARFVHECLAGKA